MEALLALTLFGSSIVFWCAILLFVIVCFIADFNKVGQAAATALVILCVLFYFWSDAKTILALFSITSVVGYFLIGLAFSVLRTFFAGRTLGKEIQNMPSNPGKGSQGEYGSKERAKSEFISEMKGNVFRWWFMWPISGLTWFATEFLIDAWDYIYSKVGKFYNYVLELGVKSIGL